MTVFYMMSNILWLIEVKFGFRSVANSSDFSHIDMLVRSCYGALLPLSAFVSVLLIVSFAPSLNHAWGQTSSNHTTLSPAGIGANNSTNQPQMMTNISKQGTYKVEIQWHTPQNTQTAVLPKNGFQLEVRFLNGTAPSATSENIPNKNAQGGVTTIRNAGTQYAVPGSIEHLLPIDSYDMTIFDSHGGVLWHKANQTTSAGIGQEQINLPNEYTGKIHILINNIKINNSMTGSNLTPLSTQNGRSDSVDFIAQVR
jgi:hypothetical protein